MTTPPITDQTIDATDPRVAQVLAFIRARSQGPSPISPNLPDPATQGPVATPPPQMAVQQPSAPTSIAPVAAPDAPNPSAIAQPPAQPGPIKAFLQHLVSGLGTDIYAGSQAAKQHLGIPTDYEMQQNAAHLNIAQQAANDNSQYRQALTDLTTGKSAQLDAQNTPFTFGSDTSIPEPLRGKTFPTVVANGLLKVLAQNQGKTDVAEINLGAPVNLSPALAQRAGMPQLAGQQVNGKTLSNIQKLISAGGSNIIQGDIGNGHTGLIDKDTQQVLQDFGPSQRILGANINANNRAVQTVNDDGSTTYDSVAHAIATHAQGTQGIGFQTDKALQKYFTSGQGGANLTAFHTATAHLDLLQSLTGALNNGDTQLINKFGNEFAKQTGSTAPTNFAAAKTAVAGEIAKVFKGVATEGEIASINSEINNAQSPAQLYGVINTNKTLMQGKVNALRDQYNSGKQGQPNFGVPAGATGIVKGSDGKNYYTDGKANLGVAP